MVKRPTACATGDTVPLPFFVFTAIMDLLPLAILAEVFFGGLLNIINVIGDIVTVATTIER